MLKSILKEKSSGIGVGIALSDTGTSEEDVTSVILQGMAAGTLLYVVFFEVLARERNNRHSGVWQLCAILAGFAVMFLLQLISEFISRMYRASNIYN